VFRNDAVPVFRVPLFLVLLIAARFRPEPRFFRVPVPAGTSKKAWPEPELCRFQRDRISNVFVSNKR
jgi:hypothetical protein